MRSEKNKYKNKSYFCFICQKVIHNETPGRKETEPSGSGEERFWPCKEIERAFRLLEYPKQNMGILANIRQPPPIKSAADPTFRDLEYGASSPDSAKQYAPPTEATPTMEKVHPKALKVLCFFQ